MQRWNLTLIGCLALSLLSGCAASLPPEATANTKTQSSNSPLSLTTTSVQLPVALTHQIDPAGGKPPYSFTLTTGQGSVSSTGVFSAPSIAGTSVVQVKDANNNTVSVVFSILRIGSPGDGLSAISLGSNGNCPLGQASNGNGNGWTVCSQISDSTAPRIISKFYVTPENAHQASPACLSGTQEIGSFDDCGNGRCDGRQKICVATVDIPDIGLPIGTTYVKDIRVVGAGAHQVGGVPCPQNYQNIGSSADCTGGGCNGNIKFCVRQ